MLERLFAADGPLARAHPAYRERPAQLALAQGVEQVLARGGTLVCEAGTGTSKSLGYLIPAALSGRRVIVSTATLALQSQLLEPSFNEAKQFALRLKSDYDKYAKLVEISGARVD